MMISPEITRVHRYIAVLGRGLLAFLHQIFGFFACAVGAFAQGGVADIATSNFENEPQASFGFKNGSFIAAPIPISDPTLGSGLVVVGGYLFNNDANSATSYIGFGGLKTSTGSLGYGLSTKLSLASNRWHLGFSVGYVDLFYDLYLRKHRIPLRQEGGLVQASAAYGITQNFSLGTQIRYLESSIRLQPPIFSSLPPRLSSLFDLGILNVGLTADWDRRDDTIYPTNGTNVSFILSRGIVTKGLARDYTKSTLIFDGYKTLFENNVIAGRVATCAASDTAPFFDSCSLGGVDSFRGFPATQYIGNRLVSLQGAWRGKVSERFGYSIFGGVGAVGREFGDAAFNDFHSAVGLGARYQLSKKFPLSFSVDATLNDFGEKLVYVYVGQRF